MPAVWRAGRVARIPCLLIIGLLVLLVPAPPSNAAEEGNGSSGAASSPSQEIAEEQTVERPRFEDRLVVTAPPSELPGEKVLSGEQLTEGWPGDLAAALRGEPGLAATRRGPIDLDPQVRGLREAQLTLMVDGTRTFAAGPGRMDSGLSHLGPHEVEAVRVMKGPYALSWGAGALAAIQVETFEPPFLAGSMKLQGRLDLGFGDNADASDGHALLWGSGDRWRFHLQHEDRRGDGYRAGDGSLVPGDYRSADSRWSLGRRVGENGVLEYRGGYQGQHDLEYAGRLLDATYFLTRSQALTFDWSPGSGALEELHAQIYSNRKSHRMNNDEKPTARPNPERTPPFGIDVDLPTRSDTTGGSFHLCWGRGDVTWKVGSDFFRLRQRATRTISRRDTGAVLFQDIVWPHAEVDDLGVYAQATTAPGRGTVTGTVRIDREEASAGEVSDFFREHATGPLDQTETSFGAAVAARLPFGSRWSLTAGAGRAVRTPTPLERYSDRFPSTRFQIGAEFLGDPGLRPETALQADLGVGYASQAVRLQIDAYHRRMDDYITVEPAPEITKRLPLSPTTVYRYVNGDRAVFWGGEAQLTCDLSRSWRWRTSVSYVRGTDRALDEPVFGLPPLTVEAGARWSDPGRRWWIDLAGRLVDRQDRVATSRLERVTPGYAVVDLRAQVELGEAWRLRTGIENLADRAYADHLSSLNPFTGERVPEPGRNVYAGVTYRF
jgi:iron complex outermembrane receptor protein